MGETRNETDRSGSDELQPSAEAETKNEDLTAASPESTPAASESGTEEFPPAGLAEEIDHEDKPIGELLIEEEEESEGDGEVGPSAAGDENATQVAPEQAAAALEDLRQQIGTVLLGGERAHQDAAGQLAEKYADALANAGASVADEWEKLLAITAECHQQELAKEQAVVDQAATALQQHTESYNQIFSELDRLVEAVTGELEKLNVEDAAYQAAPEAVQQTLGNYKKGVEIVNRMLTRARDRKKEVGADAPVALGHELPNVPAPGDAGELAAAVLALSTAFHKLRDANYHIRQDAASAADRGLGTLLTALKSVLSAVDGIDSGLANEPAVRGTLAEFEADEKCQALLEAWFGTYGRVSANVDEFLANTGVKSHWVEVGTLFDPETMEPQGTVEDPARNNDEVAAVLRRGFSLHGRPVRPIIVDVVRNP